MVEVIYMNAELQDLIQRRETLIRVHKDNDFTDGIQSLLVDLYPDTAHFIDELLQNAEDMNATEVKFLLQDDGVWFEHNGTKRSFNVADIDAITSIGKNTQKRNDPISIGKFGVGFKAVFEYTSTPEIHSGAYHFRIRDYFVPDFYNVPEISTINPITKQPLTKFWFPFNKPDKPCKVAHEEVFKGLCNLNDTSILFLKHIKSIEYMLSDGFVGCVKKQYIDDHIVSIFYERCDQNVGVSSEWLYFDKPVEIYDDKNNLKKLSIAVAYALTQDSRTKKLKIIPVEGGGRTFIYFPAKKEYSGYQFHINAPFASTVARDSVRDCPENNNLMKEINILVGESIQIIKDLGMLNLSFFEVLPNHKDNLSAFYKGIIDVINFKFKTHDYIPAKNGGFVSSSYALIGPSTLSNFITEQDLQIIANLDKKWIVNANQRNSRADNFLRSLNIYEFGYEEFSHVFDVNIRHCVEDFIKDKPTAYIKTFLSICSDSYNNINDESRHRFISAMRTSKCIRSQDNKMCYPDNIYLLPEGETVVRGSDSPIVHCDLVRKHDNRDNIAYKVYDFLDRVIAIKKYGKKVEIQKLIDKYQHSNFAIDDNYFKALLSMQHFASTNDDIDFSIYKLFLSDDGKTIVCASNLFLDKNYGNDAGSMLAKFYNKKCLWKGYINHYNQKELERFLDFVKKCKINTTLKIEQTHGIHWHPEFYEKLYIPDTKENNNMVAEDYSIHKIEKLLLTNNIDIYKEIWKVILYYGNQCSCKVHKARYRPNATYHIETIDSSLVYYLKKYAWIPDKNWNLYKPCDISPKNLHEEFYYNSNNIILKAMDFGCTEINNDEKNNSIQKIKEIAEKHDMKLITKEEYIMFEEYKSKLKVKEPELQTAVELLNKQNRKESESNFTTPKIKMRDVTATFKNLDSTPLIAKQLFARVIDSTKEEKAMLESWYHGVCQICGTTIIGYNKKKHFIAKNIINTQDLASSIRQTVSIGWNSLSLCPNCAAKFSVCSRDFSSLYNQIMNNKPNNNKVTLSIKLNDAKQKIIYNESHFESLKAAVQKINEKYEHNALPVKFPVGCRIRHKNYQYGYGRICEYRKKEVIVQFDNMLYKSFPISVLQDGTIQLVN